MVATDVIIIGTGQAGVPLATRLAAAGKRVLVAERGAPGGTCINTGCTLTKTMIASARAAHVARTARRLGVEIGVGSDGGLLSAPVRKHVVLAPAERVELWVDFARRSPKSDQGPQGR